LRAWSCAILPCCADFGTNSEDRKMWDREWHPDPLRLASLQSRARDAIPSSGDRLRLEPTMTVLTGLSPKLEYRPGETVTHSGVYRVDPRQQSRPSARGYRGSRSAFPSVQSLRTASTLHSVEAGDASEFLSLASRLEGKPKSAMEGSTGPVARIARSRLSIPARISAIPHSSLNSKRSPEMADIETIAATIASGLLQARALHQLAKSTATAGSGRAYGGDPSEVQAVDTYDAVLNELKKRGHAGP